MRTYELTCIFRTDEDNLAKGKELVKAEFEKQSVKILKETDMGTRELAYVIKKETKGHYYFYEIKFNRIKLSKWISISSMKHLF